MIGFPSNRTCTTPSSRKTRSAISSASHTRDQSRVRLLTIRTERGLDASHQRLRHQQMESDRAESGQTRQGKQCLFLAFRPRFRSFLGFMQHIGMFVLQSQATGPSVLCASQPKTFGTRRRGRLSSYTPSCLHALVFPDDYSELAISYSRQVKPAVHNHPAIPLAVNMLFCLLYSAPRQDRGKCQAKRSRH